MPNSRDTGFWDIWICALLHVSDNGLPALVATWISLFGKSHDCEQLVAHLGPVRVPEGKGVSKSGDVTTQSIFRVSDPNRTSDWFLRTVAKHAL
jgi:hypothetical protein